MTNQCIYLDYMATTPAEPKVIERMMQCLGKQGNFANPASQHSAGIEAHKAIDIARAQVAQAINASAEEIIWTSGATESDNLAIKGAAAFYQRKGRHMITMQSEHKAVLDCFKLLERQGFQVTYLKPQKNGLIDLAQLKSAITDETIFISVMHVNNEIGVIQPIAEIAELIKDKGIIFHVDAAQSIGKLEVDVKKLKVDLMSFSGHKAYGPKGIGALYVRSRPRVRLEAQMHGGGHERGFRSGTLATHQIVGMGCAFEVVNQNLAQEQQRISGFYEQIVTQLLKLGGVYLNGEPNLRVKNNINLSFEGLDGESLLYGLGELCLSSASACASASIEPSYVLKSLGVPDALAFSTIRLSLGRFTSQAEVSKAIEVISTQVKRLRSLYPI